MIDNRTGVHVKRHQRQKDTRPAYERFFEKIKEIGDCWIWNCESYQFWVNEQIVMSPWRFSYEHHGGFAAPPHARFAWTCKTPKCCNPEHIILNKTILL